MGMRLIAASRFKRELRCALFGTVCCFVVFWGAAPVFCQPVPWQITADSLVHYKQPDSIFAEGNVVVNRPEEIAAAPVDEKAVEDSSEESRPASLVIKADWVRYDVERGMIKARGHVAMVSAGEDIVAEAAILNLDTQTGVLTGATLFLTDNKIYIKGSEITKTGEFTYVIEDGWASACRPDTEERPPWAIRSTKADLTIDGMAVLKNATFHIKEVPVAYTPYLVFPAKTKRETGFLFPEISHSSRSGFGFLLPFFINLSPSSDITLYPHYLEQRGMRNGIEFRYVDDEKSLGTFVFSYLRDRKEDKTGDEYKSDGYLRTTKNRYWFRGKADHDFGDNLVARLDIDYVSDRDYLQEFQAGMLGYDIADKEFLATFNRGFQEETINSRESSLQLIKSWPDMTLRGEARIVRDVTDAGSTTTPIQTLPRIQFNGRKPIQQTPLSLAWDSEYVYFWRDEGVGEQRLDLHPQVITSLPRGHFFEGKVTAGVRETVYQVEVHGDPTRHSWAYDHFQNRTVWDFQTNIATLFMRDFDMNFGSVQWLEHTVRPNIVYDYLPAVDQSQLPSLQTTPQNKVTYELSNYFEIGGSHDDGNLYSRDLGRVKLSQAYDIREDRRILSGNDDKQRVFSDVNFDLLAYPLERLKTEYLTSWSVYGEGITKYEFRSSYSSERGDNLSLDYRYQLHAGHDLKGSFRAMLTNEISLYGNLTESFEDNHTVESSLGVVYKPHCWMMEIQTTRTIDDQRIMIIFSLDGIGRAFEWAHDQRSG